MGSMKDTSENPFHITKSNDLTDEQIDQLWVASIDEDGATGLSRPSSPMAMFILGGKGSGKSHLMRYYSFPLQLIRYKKAKIPILQGLASDKYVGIYARCGGLNAERFGGKNQLAQLWSDLFAYYFELWIADKTLEIIEQLLGQLPDPAPIDARIAGAIGELFDRNVGHFDSVRNLRMFLSDLRHTIDYAVNNASFTNLLTAEILISRGRLFFGIPSAACNHIEALAGIRFVYLLDEYENFSFEQQTYINTLIREKEGPTSFKIGARLYGIKTHRTLSGGERNLQGSEFEELRLDERFRNNPAGYKAFALKLIARRLGAAFGSDTIEHDPQNLSEYLEEPEFAWNSSFFRGLCGENSLARPHLQLFVQKLTRGIKDGAAAGLQTDRDAAEVAKTVSFLPAD
jgi:hypothetical protein